MAWTCASKELGAGEVVGRLVGRARKPLASRSSNTRQSFRPSTLEGHYCRWVFFIFDTCPWKGLATGGKMSSPLDTLNITFAVGVKNLNFGQEGRSRTLYYTTAGAHTGEELSLHVE